MPIIRGSRVLYRSLLPVVFGAKYHKQQPSVLYCRAPDDGHNGARNMLSK